MLSLPGSENKQHKNPQNHNAINYLNYVDQSMFEWFCVGVHVYLCTTCKSGALKVQTMAAVVSRHVGTGSGTQVLCKSVRCY